MAQVIPLQGVATKLVSAINKPGDHWAEVFNNATGGSLYIDIGSNASAVTSGTGRPIAATSGYIVQNVPFDIYGIYYASASGDVRVLQA
jgi:hypothetical protein